ncbi:MAG: Ig-like domain-containing protein [Lachnospiraceae bacterium]|nr:Ig-like domain-containing protein [Lachnospiraceae bacterium]
MTFHVMRREIQGIPARKKSVGRGFALLLSFALCMGSAPLTVLAAQPEAVSAASVEAADGRSVQEPSGTGSDTAGQAEGTENDEQNSGGTGNMEEQEQNPGETGGSEGGEQNPGGSSELGEGDESGNPEESGGAEGNEPGNSEENGDAGGSVTENPEENDKPGEGQEPEEPEEPQIPAGEESDGDENEEEETEQVSGNDLSSVSDNDLTSVSENSLDVERSVLIKAAQEAFDALLSEKPLMALLYHTECYDVRKRADAGSGKAATLEIGQTLYIQGVEITEDDVWYRVQYLLDGAEGTGYVQGYYLAYADEEWLAWEEEYLLPILELGEEAYEETAYGMRTYSMMTYALDTSDISAFPGSYQADLRNLKNAHPNWTFVPMKTGLDFNTSVTEEMKDSKSLIQNTQSNIEKGWVGAQKSGIWYYATKSAVSYAMDPRNFLTETYVFQFEQLTFNSSYHTESAVQTFLNNTFMSGKLADDAAGRTYAQAFFEIGKNRKLSPIHLASRVYQEQGKGTSGLISGTYPGYEGYYNFFNVSADGNTDKEVIENGLKHAKEKGWNTRYKSLDGGAALIGTNYILKCQDTLYLQKFNVDKNSPNALYTHQYMQNIQAPASESSSTKRMYANAGSLNSAFVFKIPVYDNMPNDTYYPALKLDKTSLIMNRSANPANPATQQLKFYVDGVESDPAEAKWTSSDTSVAKVQNGLITAVDQGEAVITADYKDVQISCKVTVKVPLLAVSLNRETVTLRRPDTVVEDTENLSAQEREENTSTADLQVSFDPADTTSDKTIVWTSANQKIATVKADPADSSKAVVTAVGTGEVKITAKAAKAGNQAAVCLVKVIAPIYRLELSDPGAEEGVGKTELFQGQSASLSAEYWPKDTTSDNTISWSSSNENVATVKNGRVTAQGAGTATITASVPGYTASYDVAVKACNVIFHNENGAEGQRLSLGYGESVGEERMPEEKQLAGKIFRGWYTGTDGQGSVFRADQPVYAEETHVYPHYQEIGTEKGFYVIPVGDQTYTGSAVKPKVRVFDSTVAPDGGLIFPGGGTDGQAGEVLELVEGRDYTLSYKNNKNVNTAGMARPTITVKGKGNYTGTEYVYFDIVPKALTDHDITTDDVLVAHSGKVIKASPAIYRDGKKLAANRDYTLSYPWIGAGAYSRTGVYPIVISGKGGYTGQITVYEKITSDVLLDKVSVAKIPNQTYSNELMKEEGGIRPGALTVTYKKQPLVENEHYTLSYSNDRTVGKATVTLTAVEGSGYAGSKSVTYQIVGTSIAKARVEGLENKEYVPIDKEWDAEEAIYEAAYLKMLQTPGAYSLTLNDRVLVESKDGKNGDYVVSYTGAAKKGAVKAGTATIVFQGINEYSGQVKKTYKILPCELGADRTGGGRDFTLSYYNQDELPENGKPLTALSGITTPYVKGGSKPVVLVQFQGTPLELNKDYRISYKNNNALTTAEMEEKKLPEITITGKGNFKGKLTGNFIITDGQFDKITDNGIKKITMTLKDVVYREKKSAYKTKAVLKDVGGSTLAAGKDYDKNLQYTYEADTEALVLEEGQLQRVTRRAGAAVGEEDIPQAGTSIRVTVQGSGAYAGTGETRPEISGVYRIVSADFTKAKVKSAVKDYQDGRPVTLTAEDLTVTVSGTEEPLVYGKDYVIENESYVNHTTKGKAKVTLRGIGSYGGEKTITYTIGAKKLWWWMG